MELAAHVFLSVCPQRMLSGAVLGSRSAGESGLQGRRFALESEKLVAETPRCLLIVRMLHICLRESDHRHLKERRCGGPFSFFLAAGGSAFGRSCRRVHMCFLSLTLSFLLQLCLFLNIDSMILVMSLCYFSGFGFPFCGWVVDFPSSISLHRGKRPTILCTPIGAPYSSDDTLSYNPGISSLNYPEYWLLDSSAVCGFQTVFEMIMMLSLAYLPMCFTYFIHILHLLIVNELMAMVLYPVSDEQVLPVWTKIPINDENIHCLKLPFNYFEPPDYHLFMQLLNHRLKVYHCSLESNNAVLLLLNFINYSWYDSNLISEKQTGMYTVIDSVKNQNMKSGVGSSTNTSANCEAMENLLVLEDYPVN